MSRVADPDIRKGLEDGDDWQFGVTLYLERRAKDEYEWLVNHSRHREYMLIAETDNLDDEMPF